MKKINIEKLGHLMTVILYSTYFVFLISKSGLAKVFEYMLIGGVYCALAYLIGKSIYKLIKTP